MTEFRRVLFRSNAAVSKPFLRHTLAVAGLDVALRLAQRSHPHITLLHRQALHDAIAASHRPLSRGFGLTAMIRPAGGSERAAKTVVTDLPVGLAFPDGSRRHFLFEWDTGSESIAPQSPAARGSANIVDKLVTYQTAWTAREHAARYGWQSFAVPIITASPKRAQNILALIRSHDLLRNSRLFLVTDRASLAASPDLFAHAWQTRTGTPATLVPPELLSALPL